MKTKDVIAKLQKEDPSGELDVCVGNVDISYISQEPAYYDGSQQILIRNEKGYVTGGRYKRTGHKVQIDLMPFSSLMWLNEDSITIDYSELPEDRKKEYAENHMKIRKAAQTMDEELEYEYFSKHIKERAEKLVDDDEHDLDDTIRKYFAENINPRSIFPDDIPFLNMSYIDRRNVQWSREVKVSYDFENGFILTKEKENG